MHLPMWFWRLWRAKPKSPAQYYVIPVLPGREISVTYLLHRYSEHQKITGIIPIQHDPAKVILSEDSQRRKRDPQNKEMFGYVFLCVENEKCPLDEAEIFHFVAGIPGVNRSVWRYFWMQPMTEREYLSFAASFKTGISLEIIAKDVALLSSIAEQANAITKYIRNKKERMHGVIAYVRENCLRIDYRFFQSFFQTYGLHFAPHFYSNALDFAKTVKELAFAVQLIREEEAFEMI